MARPELTHDYLKTLRALAAAVVETRRANPESPDALAAEISPLALAEVAINRSQPGPAALATTTVYRYRSTLRRLAEVLKRPDAAARLAEWLHESEAWYTTPEIREQFLASLRGDLPAMGHLLDSAAERIRTSPADRRPPHDMDPGSADDSVLQLREPRLGAPAPDYVYQPRREHVPIPAAEVRTLRDALRRGVHPLHVAFPSLGRSLPAHLQAQMGPFTGMLAEATWATGLRPIEWCSASIRVESEDGRAISMSTAVESLMASTGLPDRTTRPDDWLAAMVDLLARPLGFGVPWLVLRNAKTYQAARKGMPLERALEISRLPESTQTVIWCVAEIFRSTWPVPADVTFESWQGADRREAEARMNNASKRVSRMARRLLPDYPDSITLRSLRRDFADRAKSVLPQEEVAVMMGHTAVASQAAYGRGVDRLKYTGDRHPQAHVVPHPDLVAAFVAAQEKPEKTPSRSPQMSLWKDSEARARPTARG